jgi:hypothetical protein
MKMYRIEQATIEDLPQCLVCAEKFINFYGFVWNLDSATKTITHILDQGIFIIAKEEDKVIGGAAAMLLPNLWNSNELIFQEMFWWVEEDYRTGSIGIRLLLELEKQAPKDATIVISILPKSNIKNETLSKLGYVVRELAYTKE